MVWTQLSVDSLQLSAVQYVVSEQLTGVPATQAPKPLQVSFPLHQRLSRQKVPNGLNVFVGHGALLPVQFSGMSQTPAEALHSTEDDLNESVGQL